VLAHRHAKAATLHQILLTPYRLVDGPPPESGNARPAEIARNTVMTKIAMALTACCALTLSGCVRRSVTADHRAIPSANLGRWLPRGQGYQLPNHVFSTVFVGEYAPGALGDMRNVILYQARRPDGLMATGAFPAVGVMRLFPDGQAIWRFVRKESSQDLVVTPGFGDDFTGGYVGRYTSLDDGLLLHFYAGAAKSLTGFTFITIKATLDDEGMRLMAVSQHRHGVFTPESTTILQPGLFAKAVSIQGMVRQADW
jgi:hypothetical protein